MLSTNLNIVHQNMILLNFFEQNTFTSNHCFQVNFLFFVFSLIFLYLSFYVKNPNFIFLINFWIFCKFKNLNKNTCLILHSDFLKAEPFNKISDVICELYKIALSFWSPINSARNWVKLKNQDVICSCSKITYII